MVMTMARMTDCEDTSRRCDTNEAGSAMFADLLRGQDSVTTIQMQEEHSIKLVYESIIQASEGGGDGGHKPKQCLCYVVSCACSGTRGDRLWGVGYLRVEEKGPE